MNPPCYTPKHKILVFERFVLYFHKLHETPNDLVSTPLLFFQEDLRRVRGRHYLSQEGGIKGF